VDEKKKSISNQETGKKVAILFAFLILIVLIVYAIIMLIGNLKEDPLTESESKEVKEEITNIESQEAIIGYWESTSYVRINAILKKILEKNDVSDEMADILISVLDISDEVKLALYFKDDNTVRVAINGNMIGEKNFVTYELVGNSRLILTCEKIELSDLSNLKIGFKGANIEGIGGKIETPKISHTFEYSIDEEKLKVKVFDEKITLEKVE